MGLVFVVKEYHIVPLVTVSIGQTFLSHTQIPSHHTHTPANVASLLFTHWLPFAFCHQDRMRRHLNPLPVTKATDHYCNQSPATFQQFLKQ